MECVSPTPFALAAYMCFPARGQVSVVGMGHPDPFSRYKLYAELYEANDLDRRHETRSM